jgi:hypothetical protein
LRSAADPPCRAHRTKNVLERQFADLRVQRPHVDCRCRLGRGDSAKDAGGAFQELRAPLRDLVRVHVELLGQFDSVFSPRMAVSATLALNAGLWFRRGRLVMVSPRSRQ